jgi:hypothetical protein
MLQREGDFFDRCPIHAARSSLAWCGESEILTTSEHSAMSEFGTGSQLLLRKRQILLRGFC